MVPPLVSMIIPTYNRKHHVIRLVESIKNSDYPPEALEIVVIDDASTDGTYDAIRNKFPDVRIVRNSYRRMTSGARNVGTKLSKGDYLFFVDNDNIVDKETISNLVAFMETNKHVGIAGPLMYYYSAPKRMWCAGAVLRKPFCISKLIIHDTQLPKALGEKRVEAIECEYIPNAFLVRREIFENTGFFDEKNFPLLWEDADFSLRVRQSGYKIAVVTAAKVWHDVPLEGDFHIDKERAYFRGRNRLIFYRKYAPLRALLWPLDLLGFCHVLVAYDRGKEKGEKLFQYFNGIIHGLSCKTTSRRGDSSRASILNLIKNPSRMAILSLTMMSVIYTLLSYRGNGLTIGGDYFIPLHPTKYLERFIYSSNPWAGSNENLPPIFSLPSLPNTLLFSFLNILSFDIYSANKIYVFLLVLSSATAMYYLATGISHNNRHRELIGAMSAIAYLFNPWIIVDSIGTMIFLELSLVQSGFIFFLAFTIRYFQTKRVRYPFYSGLASFFMLSVIGSGVYRMALLAFGGFVLIAFYYFVLKREFRIRDIIIGALIIVFMILALNSYLLIPFIASRTMYISLAESHPARPFFNSYSSITNTIRLLNYWAFYNGYTVYSNVYLSNPVVLVSTFAWPVFAFSTLFWKEVRRSPKYLTICFVTLVTISIACGSNLPLGPLYTMMINLNVAGIYFLKPFYITREISAHVLTIFYTFLIGLFSSLLYGRIVKISTKRHCVKNKKTIGFVGLTLVLLPLIISGWPILTGDVMRNWYDPNQYGARIPQRYWDADSYLEKTCGLNHKVLLLPPTEFYVGFSWGLSAASQFYSLIFNVPLITGNEVPYNVGLNLTLINEVYSTPSKIEEAQSLLTKIENISVKNYDELYRFDNGTIQAKFRETSQQNMWHDLELELADIETWSTYTHVFVEINGIYKIENLQVNIIGDAQDGLEYNAYDYTYQSANTTLVPRLIKTQSDLKTILLLPLSPMNNTQPSSIWIRYFSDAASSSTITILELSRVKATLDTYYYAKTLAGNNIKYIIVDRSIVEGAKTSSTFWFNAITGSAEFVLSWCEEGLYVFENTMVE